MAGAGPSWAWLGEARSGRVSRLLEEEAGGGTATSPGASSRAAATHCSAPALHLMNRERVSSREGGGEAARGEGAL